MHTAAGDHRDGDLLDDRLATAYERALLAPFVATGATDEPVAPGRSASAGDAVAIAMTAAARALTRRTSSDEPIDGVGLLDRPGHGTAVAARSSAGGAARLLDAADGLIAVNLPRPDDWHLVPAWLRADPCEGTAWDHVARAMRQESAGDLAGRAGELGLAVSPCPTPGAVPHDEQTSARHPTGVMAPWVLRGAVTRPPSALSSLSVLDLSALWAGPLLGLLLARAGADVHRLEDPRRSPVEDRAGAVQRRQLDAGKHTTTMPFTVANRSRLAELISAADVVIEASRPRALDTLGLGPDDLRTDDHLWVSITAYGRTGPWAGRAGFGDDAAAAGGLFEAVAGDPWFVGDAVADPLTGLHGAVAVAEAAATGWRGHIDLALRDVSATVVGRLPWSGDHRAHRR